MSTDWGIGCRTCHAPRVDRKTYFSGEWDNCRDIDGLQRLIDARSIILAARDALGCQARFFWGQWDSAHASGVEDFFRTHVGHVLAPMNEYGEFCDETKSTTDEILCPWCYKKNIGLGEHDRIVCCQCRLEFTVTRDVVTTYRARRA